MLESLTSLVSLLLALSISVERAVTLLGAGGSAFWNDVLGLTRALEVNTRLASAPPIDLAPSAEDPRDAGTR